MPTIDKIALRKEFKKKSYRPWLLDDSLCEVVDDIPNKVKENQIIESNKSQTAPISKPLESQTEVISKPNDSQTKVNTEPNESQNKDLIKANINNAYLYQKPVLTHLISLSGLQRKLTLFIYEACKATKNRATPPIGIEYIIAFCETTISSVKKALQRLEDKGVIKRLQYKRGRGGWTIYELSHHIFQEIINDAQDMYLKKNWCDNEAKIKTQIEPRFSLNNSSKYNNITTKELEGEYADIDITSLAEIGFLKQHLIQIIEKSGLPAEIIQDSIDAFAFDLKKNNVSAKIYAKKTTPLNYFMGPLIKGNPYNPPANYESPQQESMRLYLEAKELTKQKEKELRDRYFQIHFEEWMSLENNEKLIFEITSNMDEVTKKITPARIAFLQKYFEEHVWDETVLRNK